MPAVFRVHHKHSPQESPTISFTPNLNVNLPRMRVEHKTISIHLSRSRRCIPSRDRCNTPCLSSSDPSLILNVLNLLLIFPAQSAGFVLGGSRENIHQQEHGLPLLRDGQGFDHCYAQGGAVPPVGHHHHERSVSPKSKEPRTRPSQPRKGKQTTTTHVLRSISSSPIRNA